MHAFNEIRLISNQNPSKPQEDDGDHEEMVVEETDVEVQPPSMFRVVLFNDDYTPMDFVVEILEIFFGMNREKATKIMLMVHTQGKAVCGVYTRDVAETKAMQVNEYARESQHPLLCEIEKDG